jgi:hypothetical protein
MRCISTQEKLDKLFKLKEHDVTNWEWGFIESIHNYLKAGCIGSLTDAVLEKIDEVFEKHFG